MKSVWSLASFSGGAKNNDIQSIIVGCTSLLREVVQQRDSNEKPSLYTAKGDLRSVESFGKYRYTLEMFGEIREERIFVP